MPTRHVLLIDLDDEADAIARYEAWHASGALPKEIGASIRGTGVAAMEIYRTGNRLVMIMETKLEFDPAAKAAADASNPNVQTWEKKMNAVQRPLAWAQPGHKWTAAILIFSLADQP